MKVSSKQLHGPDLTFQQPHKAEVKLHLDSLVLLKVGNDACHLVSGELSNQVGARHSSLQERTVSPN